MRGNREEGNEEIMTCDWARTTTRSKLKRWDDGKTEVGLRGRPKVLGEVRLGRPLRGPRDAKIASRSPLPYFHASFSQVTSRQSQNYCSAQMVGTLFSMGLLDIRGDIQRAVKAGKLQTVEQYGWLWSQYGWLWSQYGWLYELDNVSVLRERLSPLSLLSPLSY